ATGENGLRRQRPRRRDAGGTVRGLADDDEAVGLEQPPREAAEARVVIHDQNGQSHALIVARADPDRTWGNPQDRARFGFSSMRRLRPPPTVEHVIDGLERRVEMKKTLAITASAVVLTVVAAAAPTGVVTAP